MTAKREVFELDKRADTLIVTPIINLRELDFDAIEAGAERVVAMLDSGDFQNLIMDFHNTDYYGSTALAFFVKLWKRVKARGGTMAFCEVSQHEREVLELTNLISLWPLYDNLDSALAAIR